MFALVSIKFLLVSAILIIGSGCSQTPATKTLDSCNKTAVTTEIDSPVQTVSVASGAAIGQMFRPYADFTVRRVMFRAASATLTSVTVVIYKIDAYSETTVTESPTATYTIPVTGSAQMQSLWLTLPTPLSLIGGDIHLIGIIPNAAVDLQWGSRMLSTMRMDYRTGAGSGGPGGSALWGAPVDEKALSMGFDYDATCDFP